MAIFELLAALLCLLAVLLYVAAASVFLKRKAGRDIPAYSLLFACLSFIFLMAAALSCLLSAYAIFLPATLFLSAACLALHFATEGAASSSARTEAQAGLYSASAAEAAVECGMLGSFPRSSEALSLQEAEKLLEAGQEIIARAVKSMQEGASLESLLAFANRLLIESSRADGGIVLLIDDCEDVLNAKAFSGQFPPPYRLHAGIQRSRAAVKESLRSARIPLKGNILGEAALSGEALCLRDGTEDPRVFANGEEDFLRPGSYIIAPLADKNEVSGIAALARLSKSEPFSEKDFMAARILANCAAAAVSSACSFHERAQKANLERGAEAAAEMQKAILPKQFPDLPELGFGFFFRAAKGACADYCDVIFARRDRIALAVADVAGGGIASAMLMTGLRAILHLVTNTTKSAGTILGWINKCMAGKVRADSCAALAYVSYSMETRELEYSSAGQLPMLLWRAATKRMESVHIVSEPAGIDRNSEYKEIKLTAAPGDIIILFTDGLLDASSPSGLQYGYGDPAPFLSEMDGNKLIPARLSRVISENAAASAGDIAAAVKADLESFMGHAQLHDDQSLLVMKVKA